MSTQGARFNEICVSFFIKDILEYLAVKNTMIIHIVGALICARQPAILSLVASVPLV